MKTIYLREIRHIVANHSLSNKSTGYCFKSKSIIYKVIRDLMKSRLIETKGFDKQFMFVRPTEKLLKVFGTLNIEKKTAAAPSIKMNWKWNVSTQDSSFKSPAILAA